MINKLMNSWTNYVAFVKENAAESKAYQEKALLDYRIQKRMASEYNSVMSRANCADRLGRTARANELKQEATKLKDSYNNRKFY